MLETELDTPSKVVNEANHSAGESRAKGEGVHQLSLELSLNARSGFAELFTIFPAPGTLPENSSRDEHEESESNHSSGGFRHVEGVSFQSYAKLESMNKARPPEHDQGYRKSRNGTVSSHELSDIIEHLVTDRPDLLDKLRPNIDDEATSCILTEVHTARRVRRVLDDLHDEEHDSQGPGSFKMTLADDTTYYHGDIESFLLGLPGTTTNVSSE
ncbi:hypothetical protein QFC20_002854 [Naganishia adeliensis]|uniref:Uncharacterized protein n=1 Tax=Naganishia adeliensis TaxID=92952 RepID=A0ACC2WGH9_9TREE|nr:hypothetical protein QFC20_002854 [Naganishia adeliensis]